MEPDDTDKTIFLIFSLFILVCVVGVIVYGITKSDSVMTDAQAADAVKSSAVRAGVDLVWLDVNGTAIPCAVHDRLGTGISMSCGWDWR
jgi:hypothetical protein